jgi:hypothetical protein
MEKEYEIWADFGPVGNTEKKGAKYATFEGVLLCFRGQKKIFQKYCGLRTKKW